LDGTFVAATAPGLDFRSLDTDNDNALFAKVSGEGFYSITSDGVASFLFNLPGADDNSSAAFSGDDTEIYTRLNSTVRRYSATTGTFLDSFALNGMAGAELASPNNVQFDTNHAGRLFTYADGVVSEWDLGGNRIGACTVPITTPADSNTVWSFAVGGDGYV
jgi:hypothetical protein